MNLLSFNPPSYGLFHLFWFLLTIVLTVLICCFFARKHNEKVDDIVVCVLGLILFFGEVFKQIFYTIADGGYKWHQFPLQFCSMPLYIAPIVILVKNKKIKDCLQSFLAFCGLLAGISVMAEPSGVFWYPYTAMVIHSCVWHSLMIIIGVYLIVSKNYGRNIKEALKGFLVLVPCVVLAIIFNEVMYYAVFSRDSGTYCNAFYISSHYVSSLPIFADIQPKVPYIVFILLYLLSFLLGIIIVWGLIWLIRKCINCVSRLINSK